MKNSKSYLIAVIVLLVVLVIASVVYSKIVKPSLDNRTVSVTTEVTIENKELNLSFSYPSGDSAYALLEPPVAPEEADGLKKVYILMDSKKYFEFQAATELVDTPPTVSIFILEEKKTGEAIDEENRSVRLLAWAERNPQYTSFFEKSAEPELVKVDGVDAYHYTTEKNYRYDMYLISYKGNIYVFAGQFEDELDDIHGMYQKLISSVIFS